MPSASGVLVAIAAAIPSSCCCINSGEGTNGPLFCCSFMVLIALLLLLIYCRIEEAVAVISMQIARGDRRTEADNLRLQTLQQLQRILTTRQSARAFLVISDYSSRLRALSSLWLARPKE